MVLVSVVIKKEETEVITELKIEKITETSTIKGKRKNNTVKTTTYYTILKD